MRLSHAAWGSAGEVKCTAQGTWDLKASAHLLPHRASDVDLEELNTAELEPALDKVARRRGAEASEERAGTLRGDDLTESTDHARVVLDRVKLNACLNDVDGGKRAVGDGAADASSKGRL